MWQSQIVIYYFVVYLGYYTLLPKFEISKLIECL